MTRLEAEREALVHLYGHAICSDYSKAPLASSETLLALIEAHEALVERVERGVPMKAFQVSSGRWYARDPSPSKVMTGDDEDLDALLPCDELDVLLIPEPTDG